MSCPTWIRISPDGRTPSGGGRGQMDVDGIAIRSVTLYDPPMNRWIPDQEVHIEAEHIAKVRGACGYVLDWQDRLDSVEPVLPSEVFASLRHDHSPR